MAGGVNWWAAITILGYRMPFGAQLRYLAFMCQPTLDGGGCAATVLASVAAGGTRPLDRLDEPTRQRNLQRVVSNSRFLVLPWVRVRNLASRLLAFAGPAAGGRLAGAVRGRARCCWRRWWMAAALPAPATGLRTGSSWATLPVGAGWIAPMRAHGQAPKRVLVYPLVADAQRRLVEAEGGRCGGLGAGAG